MQQVSSKLANVEESLEHISVFLKKIMMYKFAVQVTCEEAVSSVALLFICSPSYLLAENQKKLLLI